MPEAREYKIMLQATLFHRWKRGLSQFESELSELLANVLFQHPASTTEFAFHPKRRRAIEFLDTPDLRLRHASLLLRKRTRVQNPDRSELTLKRRSPDFCIALQGDPFANQEFNARSKLEEDIVAPFISRFSKSTTVPWRGQAPTTLANAARIFPVLQDIAPRKTPLLTVHGNGVHETVLEGPSVSIEGVAATWALIVWRRGSPKTPRDQRVCAVELSFRIPLSSSIVGSNAAHRYLDLYQSLQRMDWIDPNARTKTAYLYGE
jgi:hypothetical protein